MKPSARFGMSPDPLPFRADSKEIGVHVLSEHVFCPQAAVLALESGPDDGSEEPRLGPRLADFADYDEHRFVEELQAAWREVRIWITLLAPAALLVLVVWRLTSPVWGIVVSLPVFYLAARLRDTGLLIATLVRERAEYNAAPPTNIDLAPQEVQTVNWWSLRKAGFDCRKPVDSYRDPGQQLAGRPWRVLTKGITLRIPVIRKHRGDQKSRPQHFVRTAAYCQLIKTCELGDAPFGVLMFAGTYECLIIPNNTAAQFQFQKAMEDVREFLSVYDGGTFVPTQPADNRCGGCPWGKPREYLAGRTDTILNGNSVVPLLTKAKERVFHCTCGDRFRWVPPHETSVVLGIAESRR